MLKKKTLEKFNKKLCLFLPLQSENFEESENFPGKGEAHQTIQQKNNVTAGCLTKSSAGALTAKCLMLKIHVCDG